MKYPAGVVARMALEEALKDHTPTERHRAPDKRLWQCEEFPKHWPSGIEKLDETLSGGFYGFAVIASEGKVGKSTLGLSSAIRAAATLDWDVRYFDGELDEPEFEDRKGRFLAAHPTCAEGQSMFKAWHVGRGVSPKELVVLCNEEPGAEPMLVVIDSINTIANLNGGNYLPVLREFSLWAMMARRMSGGAVSFLIVAETNKAGGIKGEQLQFWADCIVRLREPKERGWVDIDVTHSRRTEAGPVGRFLRHTPSASFRQHGQHLELVKAREWADS